MDKIVGYKGDNIGLKILRERTIQDFFYEDKYKSCLLKQSLIKSTERYETWIKQGRRNKKKRIHGVI